MDSKELLNWVSRPTGSHTIEVFVVQKVNSNMMFPKGKLSSDNLAGAKRLVERYCRNLLEKHFFDSDMLEKIEKIPEIVFEWWQDGGDEWYLRAQYELPAEMMADGRPFSIIHELGRIDSLEGANIDLKELRRNLLMVKTF